MRAAHRCIDACWYGCVDDVIEFLVKCWPESVRCRTNNDGHIRYSLPLHSLPLHFACQRKSSLTIIQALIQAWSDSVREPDGNGYLPLHHACEKSCTDDVIKFLVDSWPESCQIPTKYGLLPLHCAITKTRWYPEEMECVSKLVFRSNSISDTSLA